MITQTNCPKCNSENIYEDRGLWVCPDCAHEWVARSPDTTKVEIDEVGFIVKDANGTILSDGDSVTVIKDLKVKGASSSIKVGTKVKSIRLVESTDGHNISCRVDGIGALNLKSEFVRKA